MKQIVRTYGGTVITLLITGSVMGFLLSLLLSNSPIGTLYGRWLSCGNYTGTAILSETKDEDPVILFCEDYEVLSQSYVAVKDCFTATSQGGESLVVEVTYIRNIHEEGVATHWMEGEEYFFFDSPGVYQVFVRAVDDRGKESRVMVKVPVNQGGRG